MGLGEGNGVWSGEGMGGVREMGWGEGREWVG